MLETGKSYTQEIIVGPKDTALAHGSGHLEVFADTSNGGTDGKYGDTLPGRHVGTGLQIP